MALASFHNLQNQWFPPPPTFTEKDVPSQKGKVFIVTGGNTGVGYELCKMLHGTGATIYMASRSKDRAEQAIKDIIDGSPSLKSPGKTMFLHLDLNDLGSVKTAAAIFAQQESKLDILWNNAGTGTNGVQPGARTAQGFEAMVGTHCIATLLFSQLLLPQLRAAVTWSQGSARVVWTSSFLAEGGTPTNGIEFDLLDEGTMDGTCNYSVSKLGSWMLGREMARQHGKDGIVSVIQNPGTLKSGAYDGTPALAMCFIKAVLYDQKFGGYTELYAGLSPNIGLENNGAYVIPWGRIRLDENCPRKDIIKAVTPEEEGGLGYDKKFWEWCEQQWKPFV